MKTPETFIYVGGSLGLVGGYHQDARFSFVRLSDYMELEAKVRRMAMDSLHDINHIADLKAEVERLTKAVMHSPAAQLKLKELEGKTTFEDINPKEGNQ